MKSADPLILANGIHFRRAGREILKNVSCQMNAGTLTVLLGPNGAGKSTLLKVLSADQTPDSGNVYLKKRPLNEWSKQALAHERAVLPQESRLNFPFRVEEVVAMGRCPHYGRCSRAEDDRICKWALEEMALSKLSKNSFPVLSGGEKQRVHFARILAQLGPRKPENKPVVLFLDEPTSNLDLQHQRHLLKYAKRLADEGVAVLAILHDLNLAMSMADNIWLMRDGELIANGPTQEILQPHIIEDVFKVEVRSWQEDDTDRPLLAVLS